jgi:hypothetical protein
MKSLPLRPSVSTSRAAGTAVSATRFGGATAGRAAAP